MSIPTFRVEVEKPTEEMPGKIKLEFLVPYMWFGVYRPLSVFRMTKMSKQEEEAFKHDVIQRFCSMIVQEIESVWPQDEVKDE